MFDYFCLWRKLKVKKKKIVGGFDVILFGKLCECREILRKINWKKKLNGFMFC